MNRSSEFSVSQIYFELASISKNRSSNFWGFYFTQNMYVQQTPDLLDKFSTALSLTRFAKIEDTKTCKKVIAKNSSWIFFFISYNNLFSGLRNWDLLSW